MVIATGARYRRLTSPRLEYFEQHERLLRGVPGGGAALPGDPVVIVGGGNSAGQAAVFLSGTPPGSRLVVREHDLGEYMSRYLIDQIERIAERAVMLGTEVRELLGDQALEAVDGRRTATGERRTIRTRAPVRLHRRRPRAPAGSASLVALDERRLRPDRAGRLDESPARRRAGWPRSVLETSRPGIFAVGDVRSGSVKRVASAVGEGAMAIRLAFERMHVSRVARITERQRRCQ